MIEEELEKKIRHMQISSKKIVTELLAGEYKSVFKGKGVDFEEVRKYLPGDEIRSIDWNVSARTGDTYVRRYAEERELTLYFLIDLSASENFGSFEKSKAETAAQLSSLLAFSAVHNNDKVGLIIFSSEIEVYVRPAKGKTHVMRIIRDILSFEPKHRGTNISKALNGFLNLAKRRSVVFLLSDFMDNEYQDAMDVCANKHDLVAIAIRDKMEESLQSMGIVTLMDSESGEEFTLDTTFGTGRKAFEENSQLWHQQIEQHCHDNNIDLLTINTVSDYLHDLIVFFRDRKKRRTDVLR